MCINGGAANKTFRQVERDVTALVHPIDNTTDFSDDFRADSVTGKNEDFFVGWHGLYSQCLLIDEIEARVSHESRRASSFISPLKKALMAGFHPLANHNVLKTASPSFETMTTI